MWKGADDIHFNYDAYWLRAYYKTLTFLTETHPETARKFAAEMEVFKTDPNFQQKLVPDFLRSETFDNSIDVAHSLKTDDLEQHELLEFGRLILHDHPFFSSLQENLTDDVSQMFGEAVEPSYNFLSFYNNLGVCHPHMDAPLAKWTVDICLEQSEPWPLYISDVMPWSPASQTYDTEEIKRTEKFQEYVLEPGQALLFGGSAQWHYRNRIGRTHEKNFCTLIFLHYIPKGSSELAEPKNWGRIFQLPELDELLQNEVD